MVGDPLKTTVASKFSENENEWELGIRVPFELLNTPLLYNYTKHLSGWKVNREACKMLHLCSDMSPLILVCSLLFYSLSFSSVLSQPTIFSSPSSHLNLSSYLLLFPSVDPGPIALLSKITFTYHSQLLDSSSQSVQLF